ncbi:SSI family serine proteinase inhibitor [Saccharopolyspora sp. K220]|uniref:SSI family serine proteinase inhibitor n=1 Tax=Saccharopolyspora soli TaxID=2926618 RepID=UPI001F59379C|nr:SSI family serine proteinase inhibitor [Saccharopolyspora soli]MCI2419366.1 SSI family serine proteinase inhibitor [Saccharopolyspora soli]
MTGIRLLGRAVVGIAFAAAVLVPGGASAASDNAAQSTITLTVTELRGSRTVTLNCDPAGGNHPRATTACDELRRVDGNPARMDLGKSMICTKESRQVRATGAGAWRGQQVDFDVKAANPCELKARTGAVFDF